jgi:hypothetical protein
MRLAVALAMTLAACGSAGRLDPMTDGSVDPDAAIPRGDDPTPLPDATGGTDADDPPVSPRLVAIGDLHGDLDSTLEAFRVGGLIDDDNRWIGGAAWAVQVGDQLDRGDEELEIQDFLEALAVEAEAAGGKLVVLNGNHELMNVDGNFNYVTPDGFTDFGGLQGRAAAFAPGSALAKRLAARPSYLISHDTLFVHGGVTVGYADDLADLDAEARAWMRGEQADRPALLTDGSGPVWDRTFGETESASVCAAADKTMAALGVERLVVAHTVQYDGINAICDDRVWRIDVGLSDYYAALAAPTQVLQIDDGEASVLYLGSP